MAQIVTNAIVAALSAGAVAGATDTAKSAIADAYEASSRSSRRNSATIATPLKRSTSWKPSPIPMAGRRLWPKNSKQSTPPLTPN
jgi:hypothetical protein